jgi:hypothetical protein
MLRRQARPCMNHHGELVPTISAAVCLAPAFSLGSFGACFRFVLRLDLICS